MPVSYWISETGSPQFLNGSDFAAVRAAFQTWQNLPTADIRFNYQGTTPVSSVGYDGMNIVTFTDASVPLGTSVIAATFSYYGSVLGADGVIRYGTQEADIAFNTTFDFSTSAELGKYDIQGVLTHEIGHFLGLDHAPLVSSVMVPFAITSQLDQRTLSYDDIAGVMEIFPKNVPVVGQIQGTILSGTAPVLGANVVAVDSTGTAVVSTLSQPDGTYTIRFVPPGTYTVYAEPLDQPVTRDNLGGGSGGFYGTSATNFGTTYAGNVASLAAASRVSVTGNGTAKIDIQTLPQSPTGLNLTRPAFGVRLQRGLLNGTLTLGGEDITSGVGFSPSAPGIVLGTPSDNCSANVTTNCFGGRISAVASTSARMDVSISGTTALGPKNVAVSRNGDTSILSGAIVVTNSNPDSIAVRPAFGSVDGGTVVTVTGANFRAGAQVYFGGLAAVSVTLLDSGTLLATAPAAPPGFANVVVMNADGTWGVAQGAFGFVTAPPVITSVAPLSGPPATLVTIAGDHFGTLKQNVQVSFGGAPSRIISVTNNVIQAIVPYGAPSGPVVVRVVGQSASAPSFTVTNAVPSTNTAPAVYNFKDASFAAGGTPLAFGDTDDGVAFISLPFTFSIFSDIYTAGERLSVSANGWISLEGASDRAYQNASLPAATVPQTSGGTGTVPPSLIAPYWDDLILKAGTSNVSMRVAGTAPNRLLIVEWSNLSILDESGNDQNAGVTFEAVLYEGSNDIQFMYGDLRGPLSNGSSATVGMQNLNRTSAVLTSFNQPTVKNKSVLTYSYQNGNYITTSGTVDLTPPSKPVVTDEGALTSNRAQLAASWIEDIPASGIGSFQYAIGTTPGGTDVRPYTTTAQNSVVVSGLNLQTNTTYYVAVKAISGAGVPSQPGVSDGIRYDPVFQPQTRIIPSAPQSAGEFSGIALLAPASRAASPAAMNVVLRAFDLNGAYIVGPGIHNPTSISLSAGQQYAKLVTELFGVASFDGWIQVEASGPGLGIFTATGAIDLSAMDGSVARDAASDFVLFHAGASAIMVNPSPRSATLSLTNLDTGISQTLTIPAANRLVVPLSGVTRVQSSEALAAVERLSAPGKLSINAAEPLSAAQTSLVFPDAVVGDVYSSTLTLANVAGVPHNLSISFAGTSVTTRIEANGTLRLPIGRAAAMAGAVRVDVGSIFGSDAPSLVGVLDIDNGADPVTMGARPAAMDFLFPQVANGDGLFTGLALATGDNAAMITIEVYGANGGPPQSATVTLDANQQLARLLSEFVSGVSSQLGGYIHIRSDQPIWAWEIYGSDRSMASGPPL